MRKNEVKVREIPEDLSAKLDEALEAIRGQKKRFIKCPFCQRNTIAVFDDARGHVEAKCPRCGRISVFDTFRMHRSANKAVRFTY